MQAHQQRVVDEKTDLDSKLEKLRAFMSGTFYKGLPDAERGRLLTQAGIMYNYSNILSERIAAF
jgi:hypothetical protein